MERAAKLFVFNVTSYCDKCRDVLCAQVVVASAMIEIVSSVDFSGTHPVAMLKSMTEKMSTQSYRNFVSSLSRLFCIAETSTQNFLMVIQRNSEIYYLHQRQKYRFWFYKNTSKSKLCDIAGNILCVRHEITFSDSDVFPIELHLI